MAASTLDDERLGDFTAAAESYRAFVDEIDSLRRGEVVWQLGQHLAHLYVTGLALPNVVPSDADLLESSERPNVDASELETKLGDVDQYAFVFDPWDKLDAAAVTGSLADDIRDIYVDVIGGLESLASGAPVDDVIWQWRFGFQSHWGRHAAHALYAIHCATQTAGAVWIAPEDDG